MFAAFLYGAALSAWVFFHVVLDKASILKVAELEWRETNKLFQLLLAKELVVLHVLFFIVFLQQLAMPQLISVLGKVLSLLERAVPISLLRKNHEFTDNQWKKKISLIMPFSRIMGITMKQMNVVKRKCGVALCAT